MAGDITGTPEVNKVIINNEVILDLTQDTVTTDKMVSGVTAHDKSGKQITGSLDQYQEIENEFYFLKKNDGGTIGRNENGFNIEYTFPISYGPGVFPSAVKSIVYFHGDQLGEATVADVVKGKTFSSSDGIAQTGTYVPLDTSDATAAASDIAKGKTAYVHGKKVTGSIQTVESGQSYGTTTPSVRVSGNYIMAEEEMHEAFLLRKDSLVQLKMDPMKFGLAQNEEVLSGKSFTSMVGFKAKGTMPNNGAAAIQLSDLTAKSVAAGYYSGGTAKIADAEAAKIIPENIKKGVTILGVEGTMEASAGGDYNIAATTNSDGTQSLAITDAAGGGSSGGGSGETGTTSLTVDPAGSIERPILCSWQTESGWMYTTKFDTSAAFTLPNILIGGYVILSIGPDGESSFMAKAEQGVEPIHPVGLDSTVDTSDVSLVLKITSANPIVAVGLIR